MEQLKKDEYGLYIYAENYAECRLQIEISKIIVKPIN